MTERWVDIPGYEDRYAVSDQGKVLSKARMVSRLLQGKIVTQSVPQCLLKTPLIAGYPSVSLSKEGKVTKAYVHVLVADNFLPERQPGQTHVCHKDSNPMNAHYLNLRFDTPTGNAIDRYSNNTDARGENNPGAKLTESEVIHIKKMLKDNTIKTVSDKTGVNYSTVRCISQGVTWGWLEVE